MKIYTVTEMTNLPDETLKQHEREVWEYYKKVQTTLKFMELEE